MSSIINVSSSEFLGIRNVKKLLGSRKIGPEELTQGFLDQIKKSTHNAFITVCEERAHAQAESAEKKLAQSGEKAFGQQPLLGVPIAIKDILTLEGVRTTCGSRILDQYFPPYTATCVQRLEDAGAVILGKLNMDEFAMGGSNENSAYGPVLHPTDPSRVPGGSSGGSAVAVKAALSVASLGSDTGGSVRLPASYCGVVGLKPTYGRISRYGLIAFASSLDQVGPLTHSVWDSAQLLEVMAGHDPMDATSSSRAIEPWTNLLEQPWEWKGKRIGVPREYFEEGGLDASVEKVIRTSIEWFKKQGASIVEVSLPHAKYSVAVYYIVAVSEASSNLSRYDGVRFGARPETAQQSDNLEQFYASVRSVFGPEVKRRILLGTFALSAGYADQYFLKACRVRRLIAEDFQKAFQSVDLLVGPVATGTAYKLGEKSKDPLKMYLNDIFTIPANLAGIPALSVPCGEDAQGLSIGLHMMAPHFKETSLLQAAHSFEKGRGL